MAKLLSLFIVICLTGCASSTPLKRQNTSNTVNLPSHTAKGAYYCVKKGDSLWRISKQHNVSVEEIIKTNRLSSARDLKAGQKLFIPAAYASPITTVNNSSFIWPVEGEIVNFFNENVDNSANKGLNIKTTSDHNVKASLKGEVVFANYLKGWGKTIVLKHGSDFYTVYANLDDALIKENTHALKGQVIGKVASGKGLNHILHFEIRKKYIPQDPLKYLN